MELSPNNLVDLMISDEESWRVLHNIIRVIMIGREKETRLWFNN